MRGPVIVSCALTGGADTTTKSPYVPVTPQQIAEQGLGAEEAGAAVVHIHVRDPETGRSSVRLEYYEEVVDRIRSAGSKLVINLTTGPGGLYQMRKNGAGFEPCPSANPPMTSGERVAHVLKIRPDICSLDVATSNFGMNMQMINSPEQIIEMAGLIAQANVKPELEVFDLGHLQLANHLLEKGVLKSPGFFQFCLGIPWGAPPVAESILLMRSMVPSGSVWSSFAISSDQLPMVAIAAALGGHVRVGLEDNLYAERGRLATNNAELVTKARTILEGMGYSLATPAQAREILDIQ